MNHIALNNPTPPTPPKLCIARILCLLLQIAAFLIECARRLQAGRSADEDACPRLLATTACSRSVVKRRSAQCNNCRKTAQNDVIACLAGACVARVCFSQCCISGANRSNIFFLREAKYALPTFHVKHWSIFERRETVTPFHESTVAC